MLRNSRRFAIGVAALALGFAPLVIYDWYSRQPKGEGDRGHSLRELEGLRLADDAAHHSPEEFLYNADAPMGDDPLLGTRSGSLPEVLLPTTPSRFE